LMVLCNVFRLSLLGSSSVTIIVCSSKYKRHNFKKPKLPKYLLCSKVRLFNGPKTFHTNAKYLPYSLQISSG
jgi:hypothetical protein